jgi:hypothetical protein
MQTNKPIREHGIDKCLIAYNLNVEQGEGRTMIATELQVSEAATSHMILAGAALRLDPFALQDICHEPLSVKREPCGKIGIYWQDTCLDTFTIQEYTEVIADGYIGKNGILTINW